MKINANFDERVVVHPDRLNWIASPMKGVERKPLERVGGEVARATSIVRYAARSNFSQHVHTGGEEFIVLDGVFQDEHGDFPAGSYIRNPPQSSHTPRSDEGCVIFVKLWQFDPMDRTHVRKQVDHLETTRLVEGVSKIALHKDDCEEVFVVECAPHAKLELEALGGAEMLVLEGQLNETRDRLVKHSWARWPVDSAIDATAGPDGAKVWIKAGHLAYAEAQVERLYTHTHD